MGENFDLDDFVHAIRNNRTVRHVCFSGTFVRELQPEQWRTMLEGVGHLSTLEELQIWCSTVPSDAFAHTLSHASRLQKVYLFRVELDGDQDDVNALADSLGDHPSLRDVRIGGFHMTRDGVTVDAIISALGRTPVLEVVSLQLSGSHRCIPCGAGALRRLMTSHSLSDLYLSRLGLTETHLAEIADALAEERTMNLRSLDLFGNNIENEHIVRMAQGLAHNTSLETLVLPCPATDLSLEACKAISHALQTNTTLVTFNLPRSNLSDQGIVQLAQGLTINKTLRKIEVGVSKTVGNEGIEALTDMLERNYQLERVVVSSADQSIKQKTEYYMRLNEVGRGKILQNGNATREQWVEILIACADDLDCLLYFVKTNPAICQFANATHQAPFICTHELRISRRHTMGNVSDRHTGNAVATAGAPTASNGRSRKASAFS